MSSFELFGKFFKRMRMEKTGLTLRQFCKKNGLDPGNISKIERGLSPPPSSRGKLEKYASLLNIERDSDDWYDFFDFAAACSGRIPPDVMDDKRLAEKLPIVFRTLRGQKVPKEQLADLAKLILKA